MAASQIMRQSKIISQTDRDTVRQRGAWQRWRAEKIDKRTDGLTHRQAGRHTDTLNETFGIIQSEFTASCQFSTVCECNEQ